MQRYWNVIRDRGLIKPAISAPYKATAASCLSEYARQPPNCRTNIYRAGLRPMDVREDVIQRPAIPQDADEKLNCNADRLIATAVT